MFIAVMRCDVCQQLTREKDFVQIKDEYGDTSELCGWCARDHEKLAQNVSQFTDPDLEGLF